MSATLPVSPPVSPTVVAPPARVAAERVGSLAAVALLAVTGMAAALLSACGSAPPLPALPTALPTSWQAAPRPGSGDLPAPDLQGWWKVLGDATLDALVERALADNLTLAQARSRWQEARRLAAAEGRRFRPTLDAGVHTVQDAAAIDNYLHGSLEVSWEIGLFGRQAAIDLGLRARADEVVADGQAARVSVVAELVHQYIALRTAQAEAAQLQRLVSLDDRILGLHQVRDRARLGEVVLPRQAVLLRRARTEASRAAPREAAAVAAQAIAVLLGQTMPDPAWREPAADAPLPEAVLAFRLAQVPADLLRFRPDVRLAEAEVGRATSELGLAQAELYPRLTLGLAYVYAYNITQNRRNVNSDLPAFGLAVDIPLFDWGRRRVLADAREQALNTAVIGYRQTLVAAYGEAESALAGHAAARERLERLTEAERLVGRQRALQATRERLGLASALDGLEAERTALQLSAEQAEALAACSQAFVQVYKSLGGAPLAEIGAPEGAEQPVEGLGEALPSPAAPRPLALAGASVQRSTP